MMFGGAKGDRTPDLIAASDALSQLSYGTQTEISDVCNHTFFNFSLVVIELFR